MGENFGELNVIRQYFTQPNSSYFFDLIVDKNFYCT